MTNPRTTAERLVAHWCAQPRLQLFGPASDVALSTFERRYGVELPAGLREVLLRANGFGAPGDQDEVGFSFWQVETFVPVRDYDGGRFGLVDDVYLFADYLGWSWAYAIRLGTGLRDEVFIVGAADNRLVKVAASFADFVELYIADDERIYVP